MHGGDMLVDPVRVDDEIVERIRQLARFAPLHIGANLTGIAAARRHREYINTFGEDMLAIREWRWPES